MMECRIHHHSKSVMSEISEATSKMYAPQKQWHIPSKKFIINHMKLEADVESTDILNCSNSTGVQRRRSNILTATRTRVPIWQSSGNCEALYQENMLVWPRCGHAQDHCESNCYPPIVTLVKALHWRCGCDCEAIYHVTWPLVKSICK